MITDNLEELVTILFRKISTHIKLKILAKRIFYGSPNDTNGQCLVDPKQRLLKTAIEKQPQILTSSNGQEVNEILQQKNDNFNDWLERWFHSDPNPSRQKLLSYANILNAAAYRRANNKVTYQSPAAVAPTTQMAAAAAAAAAAFSKLMQPSAQQQLQLIAMAAGMASPATPSRTVANNNSTVANNNNMIGFATTFSGAMGLKQSPSSNSLNNMMLSNSRGGGPLEENGVIKSGLLLANFSSPTSTYHSHSQQQRSGGKDSASGKDRGDSSGAGGDNANGNGTSRSRLMFDPLSELPILERWFEDKPHPGWLQIEQYTGYLNSMAYQQNYLHISTHNVKIWFKNRRAKTKRPAMPKCRPQAGTVRPPGASGGGGGGGAEAGPIPRIQLHIAYWNYGTSQKCLSMSMLKNAANAATANIVAGLAVEATGTSELAPAADVTPTPMEVEQVLD